MKETHNFLILLSYFGMEFNGSAYQKDNENTVENKLIENLYKLQLIDSYDIPLSRVSRTDKGVSARINGINLRLNIKYENVSILDIEKKYVKELNKKLKNIHIHDIKHVSNTFDSRLNCIHRTYVYFFINKNYNIEKMKKAAKLFIGEHDFSNCCKKGKNVTSYRRTVLKFDIRNIDKHFYYFKIKGISFLYNQIRHMVAILFLVGKGLLDYNDVIDILNNTSTKRKNYHIADENGLLLYSFKFNDYKYNNNVNNKIFLNVMNKYIQSTMLLVSLCHPLKLENKNEDFFENLDDEEMNNDVIYNNMIRDINKN
ncbi:tRNA pseudouridine synthase,putative [Plasmodium sp. gorilla clade G2]|uniref:tRNA pseudouridine synthase,putative n=1 Tax=Plasmodium sp. gorilla clade G2 TaxID=880535 RepID=UPI000D21368F|nr:tRNA pseudouridine synthase,putative [Plasmodium sp. gorilla clade G2]SOV14045.1 tRNA pseudouridine synthase,putative [Plasmodium sp. gorilla clade G2]